MSDDGGWISDSYDDNPAPGSSGGNNMALAQGLGAFASGLLTGANGFIPTQVVNVPPTSGAVKSGVSATIGTVGTSSANTVLKSLVYLGLIGGGIYLAAKYLQRH
jgi:hypothetical protein